MAGRPHRARGACEIGASLIGEINRVVHLTESNAFALGVSDAVNETVFQTVHWTVYDAVYDAVYWTVARVLRRSVHDEAVIPVVFDILRSMGRPS